MQSFFSNYNVASSAILCKNIAMKSISTHILKNLIKTTRILFGLVMVSFDQGERSCGHCLNLFTQNYTHTLSVWNIFKDKFVQSTGHMKEQFVEDIS